MREGNVHGLIDVDDSTLVVVDTQPGFLDKLEADAAARVGERIAWLVRLARALEVPVVVTERGARAGPGADARRGSRARRPQGSLLRVAPDRGAVGSSGRGVVARCPRRHHVLSW